VGLVASESFTRDGAAQRERPPTKTEGVMKGGHEAYYMLINFKRNELKESYGKIVFKREGLELGKRKYHVDFSGGR